MTAVTNPAGISFGARMARPSVSARVTRIAPTSVAPIINLRCCRWLLSSSHAVCESMKPTNPIVPAHGDNRRSERHADRADCQASYARLLDSQPKAAGGVIAEHEHIELAPGQPDQRQ